MWVGVTSPTFSGSLNGRCYGNRFWRESAKIVITTFILCPGIPQRMGDRNNDARVDIADDPSTSDIILANFNPIILL